MSWLDYYRLLERHNGDIRKATRAEMRDAARGNPNDPHTALFIACRKREEKHPDGFCYNRSGNCNEEYCDCRDYPPNPIPEALQKIAA